MILERPRAVDGLRKIDQRFETFVDRAVPGDECGRQAALIRRPVRFEENPLPEIDECLSPSPGRVEGVLGGGVGVLHATQMDDVFARAFEFAAKRRIVGCELVHHLALDCEFVSKRRIVGCELLGLGCEFASKRRSVGCELLARAASSL